MFEGMKIKMFPDTDVQAYVDLVKAHGFCVRVANNYVIVGKRKDNKNIDYARIIRNARKENGLSRNQLADRIGVREGTIFNWEIGQTKPSETNINKLRIILGVEL